MKFGKREVGYQEQLKSLELLLVPRSGHSSRNAEVTCAVVYRRVPAFLLRVGKPCYGKHARLYGRSHDILPVL